MPTRDVLLRHFCKMWLTVRIRGCTLLSLMYSWLYIVKLPLLVSCTNPLEGCFVFSIVLLGLYDLLDVKLNM